MEMVLLKCSFSQAILLQNLKQNSKEDLGDKTLNKDLNAKTVIELDEKKSV